MCSAAFASHDRRHFVAPDFPRGVSSWTNSNRSSSGSPENRTQRDDLIRVIRTTSPRLPQRCAAMCAHVERSRQLGFNLPSQLRAAVRRARPASLSGCIVDRYKPKEKGPASL